MTVENDLNDSKPTARTWWRRKWVWIIAVILALPYLAVGSVKMYRNYQFEQNREEVLADLHRLVMTDFLNRDDPSKPIPGVGRPWSDLVKCDDKIFLNPYEQWEEGKELDEKVFLQRKLIKLGDIYNLAQWFACQGINTKFKEPNILEATFLRNISGNPAKPLWKSAYPFLFDWLPNSDRMIIRFAADRIEMIEFTGNVN